MKTLSKVALTIGAVAVVTYAWRKFEVTEKLTGLADKVLTAIDQYGDDPTFGAEHDHDEESAARAPFVRSGMGYGDVK